MVGARNESHRVLDLGCGDARFAGAGRYKQYLGVEVDKSHITNIQIPRNARVQHGCALLSDLSGFDLCIGNPPYVRHHDMEPEWQRTVADKLSGAVDRTIDLRANAFLYFMLKSLLSTKADGMVALIVPFEWVSRPSAAWLREYIQEQNWSVRVYRLPEGTFPRVLTTASLTIIDKALKNGSWEYFSVDQDFQISSIANPSGTRNKVLKYTDRNARVYAQRGLSPGTQKVFCLTEEQRIHNKLRIGVDVVPCVTSLRALPEDVKILTKSAFDRFFVSAGARCWLIRSDKEKLSDRLTKYLNNVNSDLKNTSTCNSRKIWHRYSYPGISRLLFSSGFVDFGPQFLENQVQAVAVGGVGGIFFHDNLPIRRIVDKLRKYDFESRVVNHSGDLKKIEINQLNTVLNRIMSKLSPD